MKPHRRILKQAAWLGILLLSMGGVLPLAAQEPEEVLFFDGRSDQTGTANGGTVIYPLSTGVWRFWFQNVRGSSVSPSGRSVAYFFNGVLHTVGLDGQGARAIVRPASGDLADSLNSMVSWSPSGDRLAYFSSFSGGGWNMLNVVDMDGNLVFQTPVRASHGGPPSWSPDGTRIVYSGKEPDEVFSFVDLVVVNLATGDLTTVYRVPEPFYGYATLPIWLPDGRIAFHLDRRQGERVGLDDFLTRVTVGVAAIPGDGGDPSWLVSWNYDYLNNVAMSPENPGYFRSSLAVSPDGQQLAFSITGGMVQQGIYALNVNGGTPVRLNGFVPSQLLFNPGYLQWPLLNPNRLTVTAIADDPGQPLRVGDTGVATILVSHLDNEPATYSFPDGLIAVDPAGALEFEPIVPVRPFTLSQNDRVRQFELAFTAREFGTATVTSTLARADSVDPERAEADVPVVSAGDLLIKRASQDPELFGENDVYQQTPLGQQRERISVLEGETGHFDIRVENDNNVAAEFRVMASEDPDDQWTTAYFLDETEITEAILSPEGYPTGELAAGASLLIKADFTPVTAEVGNEKNVLIVLSDEDDNLVDTLDATAKRSDVVLILTMHTLDLAGLTPESLEEGMTNIDAPLVPVTATTLLEAQEEVYFGLVADGVTPLLLRIEADPRVLGNLEEDLEVKLVLTAEAGGDLANGDLASRLRVRDAGEWVPGDTVTLTGDEPVTFAYIAPISADDLSFSSRPGEIASLLEVTNSETDETIESLEFYLRKPPIILVHGYNTNGDWGSAFLHELHESRPPNKTSFVRTGRYGQPVLSSGPIKDKLNEFNAARVNTVYPLRDLASVASIQALDREFASYEGGWAVTRHDVIAHSQGGVLSRMLCTQDDNLFLPRTFRSEKDFFRGRFHRVVTVGSPQNGSRTLYYMRSLRKHRSWTSFLAALPLGVVELMVQLDVAQYKFDPFGLEIQQINARSGSLWRTDPAAKFHIIRTTVNDGRPPSSTSSPADLGLGFNARGGMLVLPRGSDGVVDWDSMGCHGPDESAASNVFTVSGEQIAHASAGLFGGDDSQTGSATVARHARNALDQTGSSGAIQFGAFPLPPLLPQSVRDDIDLWASLVTFDFNTSLRLLDTAGQNASARTARSGAAAVAAPSSLRVALDPSPGLALIGAVNWTVEVYDHRGVSTSRLTAFPDPADPFAATIDLPPGFVGQVVVYANYETDADTIVMAAPFLALDVPPPGATVTGVQIVPSELALSAGSGVPVQAALIYDTGEIRPSFVSAQNLTAQSSDPSVLDVSDPRFWSLLRPGVATVTGSFQGIPYTAELGVVREGAPLADLNIAMSPPSGPMLTWPAVLEGFDLERATALDDWNPVDGPFGEAFGFKTYLDNAGAPQAFYRLVPR